jgi:phosphoribosylformylglycinamidine synthase PurS subunit
MTTYFARVTVMPKPGIADPQGLTIERALPALGYDSVSNVRVGKRIELLLQADDGDGARNQVEQMCERLLANTVIESFTFEITSDEKGEPR